LVVLITPRTLVVFTCYSPILDSCRPASCLVSFTDSEGIEHSIRVPAERLFEAAIEAMAAFKQSLLAEMPLAPGTRLTIRVKEPEEEAHGHGREGALVASWCREQSE
jgi:hypothetical protein